MSYECEDCGETFDTLTAKRTHDCPGETLDATDASDGTVEELEEFRERIANDDLAALYGALAAFERVQQRLDSQDGDAYRESYWEYYEPFADGLDRFTRAEGWAVLSEFVDAYHPEADAELPHVSAVIENAVGRFLIRTRLERGVEAIPGEALAYLLAIPEAAPAGADTAFEEAATYGWGISHPEHPVEQHLHDRAIDHRFWAKSALEQAFYPDQHAAVDLLETLLKDESISFTIQHPTESVDAARFFLDAVVGFAGDYDPLIPRYWDWQAEYDRSDRLDDDARDRVRALVREAGVHENLPDEWSIEDLAI